MAGKENTLRSVFIEMWHEYAVFNTEDVDDGRVIAQGTRSGKFYVLDLGDTLHVIDAEIMH